MKKLLSICLIIAIAISINLLCSFASELEDPEIRDFNFADGQPEEIEPICPSGPDSEGRLSYYDNQSYQTCDIDEEMPIEPPESRYFF